MFVIRIGIGSERRGGGTGIISIGRSASLLRGRWRKIRSRWHLASASIVVLIVSFGLGSGGGGTSTIHKRIGSFANGIAPAFQGRRRVASAIAMAHSIVHISAAAHSSSSQLALRSRRIRGASRALRQRVGSGFDAASSSSSSNQTESHSGKPNPTTTTSHHHHRLLHRKTHDAVDIIILEDVQHVSILSTSLLRRHRHGIDILFQYHRLGFLSLLVLSSKPTPEFRRRRFSVVFLRRRRWRRGRCEWIDRRCRGGNCRGGRWNVRWS
mmetsp:Transcript_21048/g.41830  ORF Transcript_21048/g.41830 Transcript_21048/m.41830 type:complete len:268 (+) Transcript_21048:87-890(+)